MQSMQRLIDIMAALRDPETGCPWDLQQSFRSIVPHTLEEAYEVADAIERGERRQLRDELGDLLFQVVFYSQLARESGDFGFEDVAAAIADKLVRRHPHVFGDAAQRDADSQSHAWEAMKAEERAATPSGSESASVLDDVPLALPALSRGAKLQRRASRVGFDWSEAGPVFGKIREELAELTEAVHEGTDAAAVEEEMGDLLFACANLARHLHVDPEQALRLSNAKFERRFRALEADLAARGQPVEEADFETLEIAYQRAKAVDKSESRVTGQTVDPMPKGRRRWDG